MIPVKRKKKWREARQKMIDRHPPNRVAFTTNIACFDLSDLADNEDDTCKEEEKVEGSKAKNDQQTSTK